MGVGGGGRPGRIVENPSKNLLSALTGVAQLAGRPPAQHTAEGRGVAGGLPVGAHVGCGLGPPPRRLPEASVNASLPRSVPPFPSL